MKKVLFVTTRLIYPVNDGRKVVLYNYCKGLAEQHNCEVRIFSLLNESEELLEQPSFIKKLYNSKTPSNFEKVFNILYKSFILRKWPLQVSLYYSRKSKQYLKQIIKKYNPDIVIADMARTAEYLKKLDGLKYNKILDMDDILSKRYKKQIESGNLGSGAIGAYSKNLPNIINKIIDNGSIMKFILSKEYKLLSKYEREISESYNSIVFVSPIEACKFNEIIGKEKSIDITIGVDYEYFSKVKFAEKKEDYIVFLGNMNVAHNQDSVNNFINNVFPIIMQYKPNCVFRIVGRCSDKYKEKMKIYKNIEITGEVKDIRKYVQSCNVAVAPLTYGSGIKTKVLECMAMGIPVITNDIGIEGININDYLKGEMVKNSNEELAKSIINILNDAEYAKKLSELQQKFIIKNHKWSEILKKFKNIIN